MRLTDLEPKFFVLYENGDKIGMVFWCPHCRTEHLGVWFVDPVNQADHPEIDWPKYMLTHPEHSYWQRNGDDFSSMTITPSIDASKYGHWHGFITSGEIT